MKHFRHERGYTLFLTILTMLLFGVLSLSLVTITISGAKKSAIREDDTQATELSEKGLKQITQQISHELQEKIDTFPDGVTKEQYIEILDEKLDDYTFEEIDYVNSVTGKYKTFVIDKGEANTLPRKVTFKSYGETDDREKILTATVLFGADVTPDDREYAVSTFISKECAEEGECKPGEGNLYLHGGVSIQGDLSVERNFITSNRSYEKYAGHHWIHSYFPSAKPKADGSIPKIIVGEGIYTFQWDDITGTKIRNFDYATHIEQIDIPNEPPYEKRDVIDDNVFVGSYVADQCGRKDHPGRNDLDIKGEKEKYEYKHDDQDVKILETNLFGTGGVDRVIYNEEHPNDKVFPKWYRNFEGKYKIRGKSTFKQFATYGDVELGRVRRNNVIEFKEGAYIGGDLRIGNNTEVKGPIFVNGDLKIDGENITINSVIFVNGMVHIKHATSDNTLDPAIKGSFILYSNGKIVMERTNRFNDYASAINGFLYSKESIEMDGNESNIKLVGGISAPRIVLNSIRGRSYAGANLFKQSNPQIVEARAYEGWEEQARRESRLQIIFDDQIFEKYSDLVLHNRVKKVSPPKVIEIKEENTE